MGLIKTLATAFNPNEIDISSEIIDISNLIEEQKLFVERLSSEHSNCMVQTRAEIFIDDPKKWEALKGHYNASGVFSFSLKDFPAYVLVMRRMK